MIHAIFTALLVAVVVLSAWFAVYVVYRLFKTGSRR